MNKPQPPEEELVIYNVAKLTQRFQKAADYYQDLANKNERDKLYEALAEQSRKATSILMTRFMSATLISVPRTLQDFAPATAPVDRMNDTFLKFFEQGLVKRAM